MIGQLTQIYSDIDMIKGYISRIEKMLMKLSLKEEILIFKSCLWKRDITMFSTKNYLWVTIYIKLIIIVVRLCEEKKKTNSARGSPEPLI